MSTTKEHTTLSPIAGLLIRGVDMAYHANVLTEVCEPKGSTNKWDAVLSFVTCFSSETDSDYL